MPFGLPVIVKVQAADDLSHRALDTIHEAHGSSSRGDKRIKRYHDAQKPSCSARDPFI